VSREAAKVILEVCLRHSVEQDAALLRIWEMCTEEEFRQYKRMIGGSMGAILTEVINPIVERFPDLKPPQLL
jgi:hypothetical protein